MPALMSRSISVCSIGMESHPHRLSISTSGKVMSRVPARAQAAFTPQAASPVRAAHEARKPLLVPPFQIFQEYGGLAGNGQLIAPRRADNGASYAFSLRRGSDGFSPLRGSRQKVARLIL